MRWDREEERWFSFSGDRAIAGHRAGTARHGTLRRRAVPARVLRFAHGHGHEGTRRARRPGTARSAHEIRRHNLLAGEQRRRQATSERGRDGEAVVARVSRRRRPAARLLPWWCSRLVVQMEKKMRG